jgi:hypothetical protein
MVGFLDDALRFSHRRHSIPGMLQITEFNISPGRREAATRKSERLAFVVGRFPWMATM